MKQGYVSIGVVAALMGLSACGKTGRGDSAETGGTEPSAAGASGTGTASAGAPPVVSAGGAPTEPDDGVLVSPSPLTRLGNFELNRSITALFRPDLPDLPSAEQLTEDADGDNPMGAVTVPMATVLHRVAHDVAQRISSDPSAVRAVAGCDPAKAQDACRDRFVDKFLRRAYRRAVTDDDLAEMRDVFASGVELGGDFASGMRAVLEVVLQGPDFLYLVELGDGQVSTNGRVPGGGDSGLAGASMVALTGYESAARLAYLLTGAPPDDELAALAEQGPLDASTLEAQARRLLGTAPNRELAGHFYAGLLDTDSLQVAEGYGPELVAAAREETARFVEDVIFENNGTFAALLTTPTTWVNGPLASLYGYPNVDGPAFRKISLDPTQRAGFLTQSAFLRAGSPSNRTSPVRRGMRVWERLLCQPPRPPSPPDQVVPSLDATGDGLTQRERLEDAKSQSPICAACHAQVDALGYAFEQYDQLGRWREVDNGRPIDASGNVELGGVQVPFSGARELSRLIADSAEGKTCFVNHWLEAALRRPASEADALLLSAMGQSFADHQERAAELMVAVSQIGNLRYRLASEVAP